MLNQLVGDGPAVKKKKPPPPKNPPKVTKYTAQNHRVYKNLDNGKFAPSSGTAESTELFFLPTTKGGGSGAAAKLQALYLAEYKARNMKRGELQEAARKQRQEQVARAREERDRLETRLANEMHARRQQHARQQDEEQTNDTLPPVPTPAVTNAVPPATTTEVTAQQAPAERADTSDVMKAEELQRLLLLEMARPVKDSKLAANSKTARAPRPVTALYAILRANLPQRWQGGSNDLTGGDGNKQAMEWYDNNFRGELFFRVPRLPLSVLNPPSPEYHSITGLHIYVLQWELLQPGLEIKCPIEDCPGLWIHKRLSYGRNKKALPLFGMDGRIDWVFEMKYKCSEAGEKGEGCKCKNIPASSPSLMALLPPGMSELYPVDPRFIQPKLHLTKTLTNWLRSTTITYLSAEMFSKLMYEMINKGYVDEVASYTKMWAAKVAGSDEGVEVPPYPTNFERAGAFPPSGKDLWDIMNQAERSKMTETGVSDHDRHRRELISVKCNLAFAFDHCFATGNCYHDARVKNTFNVTNETGQMMASFCCTSTAMVEASHGVEQLVRRPWFNPSVYYSDIFPKGKEYWNMMIGSNVPGRLGMFHFFQRIVRTLRDKHEMSSPAIKDLKQCIYEYDAADLSNVVEALREGKLGGSKKKVYSPREIDAMMYTRPWKLKYDKYLKKKIRPPTIIALRLDAWLGKLVYQMCRFPLYPPLTLLALACLFQFYKKIQAVQRPERQQFVHPRNSPKSAGLHQEGGIFAGPNQHPP